MLIATSCGSRSGKLLDDKFSYIVEYPDGKKDIIYEDYPILYQIDDTVFVHTSQYLYKDNKDNTKSHFFKNISSSYWKDTIIYTSLDDNDGSCLDVYKKAVVLGYDDIKF